MPLNGSGTFVPAGSSVYPAVTTTSISSTDFNALMADVVTALSTAIYKDGQSTPTANIPMGGFKITGLAAGTLVSDATRVSQVQNSSFTSLTAVAGTNTITATATPTPAAYVVGQVFEGIAAATNTAAVTMNVSSLGAGAVQVAGAALTGGEFIANAPFRVMVSAVTPVFQLIANGQVAPFLDTNPLIKGSADGTKKIRFEVDGLTTATTRVITAPDKDITLAGTADISAANGASVVLLQTNTPSASATSDFTSVITSTYDEYIVELIDVLPATSTADLQMQTSTNNGGAWTGTVAYVYAGTQVNVSGATGVLASTGTTQITFLTSLGNGAGSGVTGEISFRNGFAFVCQAHLSAINSSSQFTDSSISGRCTDSGVNAIRFKFSSGNITSGTIRLYGRKKT